jgi:hypothetical protein
MTAESMRQQFGLMAAGDWAGQFPEHFVGRFSLRLPILCGI